MPRPTAQRSRPGGGRPWPAARRRRRSSRWRPRSPACRTRAPPRGRFRGRGRRRAACRRTASGRRRSSASDPTWRHGAGRLRAAPANASASASSAVGGSSPRSCSSASLMTLSSSIRSLPPLQFFAGNRIDDALDVFVRQRRQAASGVEQAHKLGREDRIDVVAQADSR